MPEDKIESLSGFEQQGQAEDVRPSSERTKAKGYTAIWLATIDVMGNQQLASFNDAMLLLLIHNACPSRKFTHDCV